MRVLELPLNESIGMIVTDSVSRIQCYMLPMFQFITLFLHCTEWGLH
jgi:hypothetical protein